MKLAIVAAPEDKAYLSRLKPILAGHTADVIFRCPTTVAELTMEYDGIICSQEAFLNKVVQKTRKQLIHYYAGSFFWRGGKPIVIINPPQQMITTATGEFLTKRYISKVIKPSLWQSEIPFEYQEITEQGTFAAYLDLANSPRAVAISIDIETAPEPLRIQICSYSIIRANPGRPLDLVNFTFEVNSSERLQWMRALNETSCPKIFQNGIYDCSWFVFYSACPTNWTFDTMDLFHAWYAELPKRLDFVTSFCVRESWFWKNDNKTGQREDFIRYGCMDVWATSCSFLYLIENLPNWAWVNYINKFPVNFPSLLSGLRGWKIDEEIRAKITAEKLEEISAPKELLCSIIGNSAFNPGSPQQTTAVLQILSTKPGINNSDKKAVETVSTQHPLNTLICSAIADYREAKKIVTSYLEAKLHHGRFLYTLAPSGTDTSRLASHGSVFWTGNSIQVIPRGSVVKSIFISDDGFYLAEPDADQADARGMAYLSGDKNLIATVEDSRDFHRVNAEKFFGVAYDIITTELRDLSKRVNHGVNFNMAAPMLLATMGAKNVFRAKQLLRLPGSWSLLQVTQFLLDTYHKTYPGITKDYYPWLLNMIAATRKYTGPTELTRFFFGDPNKNKLDKNALIAHTAQSLTGQIINLAFLDLYQLEKRTNGDFKLLAQIHDSIPFQYRIGRLDLACEAAKIMERFVSVKDCKGIERQMKIPISLKAEASRWSELKKIPDWRTL